MLTLRREQMNALETASLERDVKWLSQRVAGLYARTAELVAPPMLDDIARHVIDTGRRHEIAGKNDLLMLMEIMLSTLGHAFDLDPLHSYFGSILARRDGLLCHPTIRVERCHEYGKTYCTKPFATGHHTRRVLSYMKHDRFDAASPGAPEIPTDRLVQTIAATFPEKFDLHPVSDIEGAIWATVSRLVAYGVKPSYFSSQMAIYGFLFGFLWFADSAFPEVKAIFERCERTGDCLAVAALNEAMSATRDREARMIAAMGST
jgi:hypothetical protein